MNSATRRHKIGIIALSGYNSRSVVAFCRFAQARGILIHLYAKDSRDPILLTDYKSWVFRIREVTSLTVHDFISFAEDVMIANNYTQVMVLPTSEFLNRFLLENLETLTAHKIRIPLVEKYLYSTISDKYSFSKLCIHHGLKVPLEYHSPPKDLFPYVAKPKTYSSANIRQLKPYLIYTASDYEKLIQNENIDDFYFQDYIDGPSYYLLFYISKNGADVVLSQENFIQQSGGGSMIAAVTSDIHNLPIADNYIKLFKKAGFSGLVMVELKKRDDEFYMIEANPRMWGPLQLVVDSGSPMLDQFLLENEIESEGKCIVKYQNSICTNYFWSGGIVIDQNNHQSLAFHNYSAEKLVKDYAKLISHDIYLRDDTINIYINECKGEITT